jgi:K+-transporting ATPase A subunit
MADKEVRFGIANTSLFATATTASSDGAVNGGLNVFTRAGGVVPLLNIFAGGVIVGGGGSAPQGAGSSPVFHPGAHRFTESLYAWMSMANTNGSASARFGGTRFTASLGAVPMTLGRFGPLRLPALTLGPNVEGLAH